MTAPYCGGGPGDARKECIGYKLLGMCNVDGCKGTVIGNGMCRKHYSRMWRYGCTDERPDRRARQVPCAHPACGNTVVEYKKYCSRSCYWTDPNKRRDYKPKSCKHCTAEFAPLTPNQQHCLTCLGPPVGTTKRGAVKYEGMVRLRTYGVSHPEWLAMVARYDGMCWICRRGEATQLDHCHKTGKVRGALCSYCNVKLQMMDRTDWFEAACAYLGLLQGADA